MVVGVRPEARLCRPFWLQLEATAGSSARFRVPDGWVIRDMTIGFNNTNYLKLQASSDREHNSFVPISFADFENGILPFYFDSSAAGSSWYPSTSVLWEWRDIQYSEIRCVYIEHDVLGWAEKIVQVAGVLVPDPRRY